MVCLDAIWHFYVLKSEDGTVRYIKPNPLSPFHTLLFSTYARAYYTTMLQVLSCSQIPLSHAEWGSSTNSNSAMNMRTQGEPQREENKVQPVWKRLGSILVELETLHRNSEASSCTLLCGRDNWQWCMCVRKQWYDRAALVFCVTAVLGPILSLFVCLFV
jgi:hypothetical protein